MACTSVENWVHAGTRKGAVRDAVPVNIEVSSEFFERFKDIFVTHDLATIHCLVWVCESFTSPSIHSQVEVAQSEDWGLESLGVIKSPPSKFEALFDGSWNQDDVLRIAVASFVKKGDVRLLSSSWQSSRWAHTVDVPEDGWDFCKVSQTDEFLHQ